MLEIDETILSRIMNGFRQPGPEMRKQIALVLESDEVWLFETENEWDGKLRSGKVTS